MSRMSPPAQIESIGIQELAAIANTAAEIRLKTA